MKKRILSLLLTLVMILGMIPATTLTAFAESRGEVYVGGVAMYDGDYLAVGATTTQTTKPSGGYAYYKDRTLTLNNYSYEGKGYLYNSEDDEYATVFADNHLTVELVGTNTLKQTASLSEGIRVGVTGSEERLTIQGDGSLNVTSTYCGILAWGLITVNGGTIISTATGGGGYKSSGILSNRDCVIINGGNVTVSGDYGLWVWMPYGSCEINGGTVTATGIDQAIQYFIVAEGMKIQASTTVDGALGEYVAKNNDSYKKIVITGKPINNINVSATFSGTPAKATTSTTGATVTATKWYKKNGSGWTELGTSDTIKEGGSYRCEVTVAATYGCQLANGYTVYINGIAATKKSGNTWYRDVTITGISDYVEVNDIDLPEAYTNPDFTYDTSDVAPSRKHWDVAKVEWFECDKDGHILSGALTENYVFQKDTYYRVEVTVVPETNWQFHGSALDFYINGKAAMPLYGYNKAYPNSVTGYVVYHVDDANGTYTVQIGDITLKDGDYLANNATSVTTVKPVGGYAYYKDGVLTLNNFVAAKLVRYYERYLEVELIGENKIGAIADYYYWDTTSNNYYTGLEFRGDGDLEFDDYYDDPCCNVSVNGDVFFNGSGDILLNAEFCCFQYTDNVIINDGYVYCYCSQFCVFGDDTNITVNGGKLKMYDGGSWYDYFICDGDLLIYAGSVYVSVDPNKTELADCVPWDGVTDLNTYECVWIVTEPEAWVGGVGMSDGDYLAVGATATQTTKPSGGYAYYKDGVLTLNNYSYEGIVSGGYCAVIYAEQDISINLIGNNTLTQTKPNSNMIYVYDAALTVGGNGKLIGTAGECALFAYRDLTINGGNIALSTNYNNTIVSNYGEVIINGGDIVAESKNGAGIDADEVTINGGNVTAIGGYTAINYNFFDSLTVAEDMEIRASTTVDGELGEYVAANLASYKKIVIKTPGVYVGGVGMYDGDYLAVGATATQTTKPSGGYAYYKDGVLTLNNYSYEGYGCDAGISNAIIYALNDIQIELVGSNNLTHKSEWNTACITAKANVSLTGEGTLNLQNATWGIDGSLNISIESGSLNIDNCKLGIYSVGSKVIINGGNFEVNAIDCAVDGSKGIEINGGSGIFRNTQENVFSVLHSENGTVTINPSLIVMASTTADGALGEYVAANHDTYKKIVVKTATSTVLLGDVNLDGQINSVDSNLLKRILANAYKVEEGSDAARAADVNGDGATNAIDSNLLKRKISG